MRRHDFLARVGTEFPCKYPQSVEKALVLSWIVYRLCYLWSLTPQPDLFRMLHDTPLFPVRHNYGNGSADGVVSPVGGGRSHWFAYSEIAPYACNATDAYGANSKFAFIDHVTKSSAASFSPADGYIHAAIPLHELVVHIPVVKCLKITRMHSMKVGSHVPKKSFPALFEAHQCTDCVPHVTIFRSATAPP